MLENHELSILKRVLDSLPGHIYWKDKNSVYLGCNAQHAKSANLASSDDIIGKTDYDLSWGERAEVIIAADKIVFNEEREITVEESIILPGESEESTFLSIKMPLYNENGKVEGLIGISLDITDKKKLENELKKTLQKAKAANQAKSAFIANISHDIRTPLTGILGMAKIIAQQTQSDEVHGLVQSSERLLNLLNEIIELSKIESGTLAVHEMKFSLHELLANIIQLTRPAAKEKWLELDYKYDESLPNYVLGDQIRLHRILLSLITNAIKFTDQGGIHIGFKLESETDRELVLAITVRDTGPGLSEEEQSLIFQKFTRLTPSFGGLYQGLGLGLFIAKQFLEDLQGEIHIDSKIGKGTTFSCYTPLRKSLSQAEKHRVEVLDCINLEQVSKELEKCSQQKLTTLNLSPSMEPVSINHKKILVVEDDPIAQKIVEHMLTEAGFSVSLSSDGTSALNKAKEENYDLILLDLGLPDQSGYEVMKATRQLPAHTKTPIIALTAHIDRDKASTYREIGFNQVFVKPLDEAKLKIIKEIIRVSNTEL